MKKLLIAALTIVITGCASKPQIEILVEREYVTYDIPMELTASCKPPFMIPVEEFSMKTSEEKNLYLSNYIVKSLGELKKCNNRVIGAKEFVARQNELVREAQGK